MWDIYTIVAENNRYALQSMMGGIRLERVRSVIPDSWPLTEICQKLQIGPPLLEELIQGFIDIDTLERFQWIIREYLPEHEVEIMSQPRKGRVGKFCQIFARRYYPLPFWAERSSLDDFTRSLPYEALGMSWDGWHEMNMRPGYLMLLSLVIYPYEGDPRDEDGYGYAIGYEDGMPEPRDKTLMDIFCHARVALMDAVQNIVGGVAKKIPDKGWTEKELHLMTDGTKYDGVGDFASWVMALTGCIQLDSSYDDFEYIEGWGEPLIRWARHNVDALTKQWPKVVQIRKKIDHIVEWLEEDPRRFQELVEFLLKEAIRKIKDKKDETPFYYDATEHWCPLDQITTEDYEGDEDELGDLERVLGGY